jgi:hypothetical protein
MRTKFMEYSQGSYIHGEEFKGLHINLGNAETKSNGRRYRKEPVTMRSMHREVKSYMDVNERIMKAEGEMLQRFNMLHKKVNNYSGTKQEASARQVSTSRSHNKRDDHGNDRKSRSMSMLHNSPRQCTIRTHASSGP